MNKGREMPVIEHLRTLEKHVRELIFGLGITEATSLG
jgi:hypothetical protein